MIDTLQKTYRKQKGDPKFYLRQIKLKILFLRYSILNST